MREPPQTDEGWYVLHDFRTIDWDAWQSAPDHERERALREGMEYLEAHESVADADEGGSAVFGMLGHESDLLLLHFRPTLDHLSRAERAFDRTAMGAFTDQTLSYVSVTEVSGYVSDAYFADDEAEVDAGLRRYIEGKLKPEVPEDEYVCFYPMSKRRGEKHNWYDLPFEDRVELMEGHGKYGRRYGGRVSQVISSSFGFDDHEWGVTLFAANPIDLKDIVYELRFDEATSKYGEFGSFYVGRRFPPEDLPAYFEAELVPTAAHETAGGDEDVSAAAHEGDPGAAGGHEVDEDDEDAGDAEDAGVDDDEIRGQLEDLNIYAGQPHGEDVHATVLYSEADTDELFEEVDGLRANFDHYDTHVKTAVYEANDRDRTAVVSIWETASAAETAAGFLSELPEIVERAGEESGFGTMGMFYTTKPEYTDEFVEKFETVEGMLEEMDGHEVTDLMVNVENEDDMFISSQWRSKEDAMGFFRSDAFRDTVQWGRDVLADRPRHVFLA